MRSGNFEDITPLTPQSFHILLALAEQHDNGYALLRKVQEDSGGVIKLAPGTLYPALRRLEQGGLLEAGEPERAAGRTGQTHVYYLSSTGKMVLKWELDRYARAVELGRQRLVQ